MPAEACLTLAVVRVKEEVMGTDLCLGQDNNRGHQNADTQGEKAVSLLLGFSLRQKVSSPHVNKGSCRKCQ